MMKYVLEMLSLLFEMMNFALKMMNNLKARPPAAAQAPKKTPGEKTPGGKKTPGFNSLGAYLPTQFSPATAGPRPIWIPGRFLRDCW